MMTIHKRIFAVTAALLAVMLLNGCGVASWVSKKLFNETDDIAGAEIADTAAGIVSIETSVFADPRNGYIYPTLRIGNIVWMTENLNYKADSSWCYRDDAAYCKIYGRLYNWYSAMEACPDGWRLPKDGEWDNLFTFAGVEPDKKLKAIVGWQNDGNGTDEFGFSALPGGLRMGDRWEARSEDQAGSRGTWWTSTEYGVNSANARIISSNGTGQGNGTKSIGYSVRCVSDVHANDKKPAKNTVSPVSVQTGEFTDPRDDKIYRTVKIGKLTWMAENLGYETDSSRCFYDKYLNCSKYGRLYSFSGAANVCPAGWRLPNNADWDNLTRFAGGKDVAGVRLKSKNGWYKNGNGADDFGFSAQPAGLAEPNGEFFADGYLTYWWSAAKNSAKDAAGRRYMVYDNDGIFSDFYTDGFLASVRCVTDNVPMSIQTHSYRNVRRKPSRVNRGANLTDERDGQTYQTVKIDKLTWMAENLNYHYKTNGMDYKNTNHDNALKNSWCLDNHESNCARYGRLYGWDAAMKACPSGWRLPDDKEWESLFKAAGGDNSKLKARTGWRDKGFPPKPAVGTDDFGFWALPGGLRKPDGGFISGDNSGLWWTSTEYNKADARFQIIGNYYYDENWYSKDYGLSVRCVKD